MDGSARNIPSTGTSLSFVKPLARVREIDTDKINDAVLALLYSTLHDGVRNWESFDWDAMKPLHVNDADQPMRSRPFNARLPRLLNAIPQARQLTSVSGPQPAV